VEYILFVVRAGAMPLLSHPIYVSLKIPSRTRLGIFLSQGLSYPRPSIL
jgi:hypothetical protein